MIGRERIADLAPNADGLCWPFVGSDGQVGSEPYCSHPDPAALGADQELTAALATIPVGAALRDATPVDAAPEVLTSYGFTADRGLWLRWADMMEPVELATFDSPALPAIDCIVIISVDRQRWDDSGRKIGRNFVYDTLADVLHKFPADVIINVLVGNDNTDYLSDATLARHNFSASQRDRLRIVPASGEVSDFLRDQYISGPTKGSPQAAERRASWNYARALGGYSGRRGLLLMEDDVQWTANGIERFALAQNTIRLPIVSLFAGFAYLLAKPEPPAWLPAKLAGGLRFERPVMADPYEFYCTQAMYFDGGLTREASRYLLLHAHERTYDHNLHHFMFTHGLQLGYINPSLAQHMGAKEHSSVGTRWFPQASDFVEWMPPLGGVAP